MIDRQTARELASASVPSETPRPGKATRIGVDVLGYLGSLVADAAIERRCGNSLQCRSGDGTIASANGRVLP